ncbi:hypothetical protein [Microvirga tunisiensis]|uniref:Uncharacterized protein n=1 Tax=Microvirga tunisiensis TaxID=2108360 RepID=A0A5N7MNC4_9HYPH|nr:hypothetical protein [Microvirga tunisiensis]MPR10141.1 hypothetical protein [Microvirga tunisiensis]MPR28348.1 hypothetical protein [Microvirga tunisiensis]
MTVVGKKLDFGDIPSFLNAKNRNTPEPSTQRSPSSSALTDSDKLELITVLQAQIEKCHALSSDLVNYDGARPVISIKLNQDGTLRAEPSVVNSSSDKEFHILAANAITAVKRCAPLQIPARFADAYAQWREMHVQFQTTPKQRSLASIEDDFALGVINPTGRGDVCFYKDGGAAERVLDQSTKSVAIQFPNLQLRALQKVATLQDVIRGLSDGMCAAAIVPNGDIAVIKGAPRLANAELSVLDGNADPELKSRREQRDRRLADIERAGAARLAERERTRPERERKQLEIFGILLASLPREIACGTNLRCNEPLASVRMVSNFSGILESVGQRVSKNEMLVGRGGIISAHARGCRQGAYSLLEAYEGYAKNGVGQQFPMSGLVYGQVAACNAAIAEINSVAQALDIGN